MFELLLLRCVVGLHSYRFAGMVRVLLVRVTPRLAMAGKENFCIDMKGDTPRVCVGYRQQSVPTAFERTRVMHGKSRISLHG